jgi:hypothetical protein
MMQIVFLITVIIVILVFFFYVRPARKGKRENFVQSIDNSYKNSIVKVFNLVLGRDPHEFELLLYKSHMSNPVDTTVVQAKLLESTEAKNLVTDSIKSATCASTNSVSQNNTLGVVNSATVGSSREHFQNTSAMNTNERLELYKSIIQVYEQNLDRLPTTYEIEYYALKMLNEFSFTLKELQIILTSSKEYDILQKNQTNLVNAQVPGDITDAQLTLIVNNIYFSLFSVQPNDVMEKFIKAKYIEYKFNDEKFKRMLLLLHQIDGEKDAYATGIATNTTTSSSSPGTVASLSYPGTMASSGLIGTSGLSGTSGISGTSGTKIVYSESYVPTVTSETSNNGQTNTVVLNDLVKGVQQLADSIKNSLPQVTQECPSKKQFIYSDHYQTIGQKGDCDSVYSKNKFTDSLYDNLKNVQSNTFTCPNNSKNSLADVLNKRNDDELKYQCSRNAYYLSIEGQLQDHDPNLSFQYKNTRFGTFLEDADNTKVGSILPKFIYKEY